MNPDRRRPKRSTTTGRSAPGVVDADRDRTLFDVIRELTKNPRVLKAVDEAERELQESDDPM